MNRVTIASTGVSEYSGDSTQLLYLRARQYSPIMGRFLSMDMWAGDSQIPLSFNGWNYSYSNPINYSDPSGLCPTCVVYFFPGAGNKGDLDDPFGGILDGRLDDNLGPNERVFVQLLRQGGVSVKLVYPYGVGIRTNWAIDRPLFGQYDANGNFRYAILPSAFNVSTIPAAKADEIVDPTFRTCQQEDKWNITFIGYSGGGQMAYSTAQELTGRMFVDNLVLLGAPFRAYNRLGNIGYIWDLVGQNDTEMFGKGGEKKLGWDHYNRGYRYVPTYGTIHVPDEDIYQYGASKCTLYGPQYIHYGNGDYFEARTSFIDNSNATVNLPFNGALCSVGGTLQGFSLPANDKSRLENLVNFLINVVGIGRQK